MQVGEALGKAGQILNELETTTPHDAQVLANTAIAYAVLALAEQVAMVRQANR